jgi:restriction system protein
MWMVRAGIGGVFAEQFIEDGIVGMGGLALGDPSDNLVKTALLERFARAYPDKPLASHQRNAAMLLRFWTELEPGDEVITYHGETRRYHIGEINGPARWEADEDDVRCNVRPVRWHGAISRDVLGQTARNSLGSVLTLFKVPAAVAREIRTAAANRIEAIPPVLPSLAREAAADDPYQGLAERARQRIEDRIAALEPAQMEELVAALLRALGYRTRVTARGPDRGRDVIASPDGFGFQGPRIIVEVKHRRGTPMGAPDVRALGVGQQSGDRGLFVSTGGFSKEAHYEAERARVPVTLMSLPDLTRAILEVYDRFDEEGRRLLPLSRIYWPLED